MPFLVYGMIALGIVIMMANILGYLRFLQNLRDVISASNDRGRLWKFLVLLLLGSFFIGYLCIVGFCHPDFMTACILLGGSVFVAVMLALLFHLIDSIKENCLSIMEVLVGMIESRDPNLDGHSRHVQSLTMLLFGCLPGELRSGINPVSLEYAALLHDVGKLGIPESVLHKPGKLTEGEWQLIKDHPRLGVQFLKPLKSFRDILPWILYHHEHVDGSGYYGVPGALIPVAARVIAVCDTYSAIVMRRAYKEPHSHEIAMKIITEAAGTQLDQYLVQVFAAIPQNKLERCLPDLDMTH